MSPLLSEYIINHTFVIDKSTYITVILGQITIYGILLTFYQFVASFEGTSSASRKYLGVGLTEYCMRKKVSLFRLIVSKPYFYILFLLEVLYKPVLSVCGAYLSTTLISIGNFLWYLFVVLYFIVFIILFWQCTRSIFSLKIIFDTQKNGAIINELNQQFMHKSIIMRMRNKAIDLLTWDIEYLIAVLKNDTERIFYTQYHKLMICIFDSYLNSKQKEIQKMIKTNRIPSNQVPWIYTSEQECRLLQHLLNQASTIDEQLKKELALLHLKFVKLFLQRASAESEKSLNLVFDNWHFTFDKNSQSLDCLPWEELTISFFENSDLESRKFLINTLYSDYCNDQILFREYCEHCIMDLMSSSISEVLHGERQQQDFCKVFNTVLSDDKFNDHYAFRLCDSLTSCQDKDRSDIIEMIKLLNKENATYLFCYIIIYHSIYKFRFDWKYLNIAVLNALWSQHTAIKEIAGNLIEKFKNSHISHRFSENMLYKFNEYLKQSLTGSLLNTIYQEKIMDMFYITIIKLSILDESYNDHNNELSSKAQIYFVNQLANHCELMKYDQVKKIVNIFRYKYFLTWDRIPKDLDISLKTLLLTNISLTPDFLSLKYRYCYCQTIGEYCLIKLPISKNNIFGEFIRNAYIAKNMSINEYIDYLSNECDIFGTSLNYVHKEKMKEYLISII